MVILDSEEKLVENLSEEIMRRLAPSSAYYALRFAILKRDNFTCRYCGMSAPTVRLEVDHVIPVARGGSDHEDNLVTACYSCNRGKGDLLLMRSQVAEIGGKTDIMRTRVWNLLEEPKTATELAAAIGAAEKTIDALLRKFPGFFTVYGTKNVDGKKGGRPKNIWGRVGA